MNFINTHPTKTVGLIDAQQSLPDETYNFFSEHLNFETFDLY